MLLQANDFVELHQKHGCTLQIGGSDQWGNIIAGVRLVRQKLGASRACADGAAGHLGRRQEVRQVHRRRQRLARPRTDVAVRLVPVLLQHRRRRRHPLPALVHVPVGRRTRRARGGHRRAGARARRPAPAGAGADHAGPRRMPRPKRSNWPARRCSAAASCRSSTNRRWLRRCARHRSPNSTAGAPDGIGDLLVATGLSKSKGEARRTLSEGGVYVNNVRVDSDDWVPARADFLHGKWLVLRRGKRNIAGVETGLSRRSRAELLPDTPSTRQFDSPLSGT